MCGIAGIWNRDGRPCETDDLRRFTDALTHRGPDGWGVHVDGGLGLGHRRLSILDLSECGKQPMSYLGGRYWITYNGEVYNFVELRRELEAAGVQFASQTDTEVIVAAYHRWGADCLLKFNGMWAFAIWDRERHELFLSRDRFGIKPLHYLATDARFAFASELKAFLRLSGFTPRENKAEMQRALSTGRESTIDTFIDGVKMLPAGHNMLVTRTGVRVWRWWDTLEHLPTVPARFSDQVAQFREMFFSSCQLRLRSDVPVATCLSGGLDSSSILCTVAAMSEALGNGQRVTHDFHRAFVATFPGTPQDEQPYAEAAIKKANADPRLRRMDAGSILDDLKQYAYDFETIGSVLLMPVWRLYRELRRDGVVVSLDGHGADEVLAGYDWTLRAAMNSHGFSRAPFRVADLARTVAAKHESPLRRTREVMQMVVESDPLLRFGRRAGSKARRVLGSLVGSTASKPSGPQVPPMSPAWVDIDDAEQARIDALSPLNRSLYGQVHYGILPSILRKYDRLSMAHGIETRMPFLDWRLVTFAFALPDESKAGHGFTKRILRESMTGVLPEVVRTRMAKIGFRSPMQSWFNGELGPWVADQVQTDQFLDSDLWDGPAIRDLVLARHANRSWTEADALRIWPFLQANLWRGFVAA